LSSHREFCIRRRRDFLILREMDFKSSSSASYTLHSCPREFAVHCDIIPTGVPPKRKHIKIRRLLKETSVGALPIGKSQLWL
jgi:hypothetical protein